LERVDRDVDLRSVPVTDGLAVVEHRRLVLLPLADHHDTPHRDGVDYESHEVEGRLVRRVLLTTADPARGAHGRGLGDTHELEREVPVRCAARAHETGSYEVTSGREPPRR